MSARLSAIEKALAATRAGTPVVPLFAGQDGWCGCPAREWCEFGPGAHPRIPWGEATTDEVQIAEWWSRWPLAPIGVLGERCAEQLVLFGDSR